MLNILFSSENIDFAQVSEELLEDYLALDDAAEKYLEGYQAGSLECRDLYLRCSRQLKEEQGSAPEKAPGP